MLLKSLEYSEYEGTPREWVLDHFPLGQVNLLVGKNASGKTRTLNVITGLANLLSGDRQPTLDSGKYRVQFDKDGEDLEYSLGFQHGKVVSESFTKAGKPLMTRSKDGQGEIFAEKQGVPLAFQAPEDQLVAVARRDKIQHPFFDDLYNWGKAMRSYQFGTELGRTRAAVSTPSAAQAVNPKDAEAVVNLFLAAKQQYEAFVDSVKGDMTSVGFPLDDICTDNISVKSNALNEVLVLTVKEPDIPTKIAQTLLSQGMFRALSLVIHLNYCFFSKTPSLIVVDDIGEGLDYQRSSALIKLVMAKAKKSSIQLLMSTNDQFVMNIVPLEYWQIIQRTGGKVTVYNQRNARGVFDKFNFSGLSNFDFFTSGAFIPGDN